MYDSPYDINKQPANNSMADLGISNVYYQPTQPAPLTYGGGGQIGHGGYNQRPRSARDAYMNGNRGFRNPREQYMNGRGNYNAGGEWAGLPRNNPSNTYGVPAGHSNMRGGQGIMAGEYNPNMTSRAKLEYLARNGSVNFRQADGQYDSIQPAPSREQQIDQMRKQQQMQMMYREAQRSMGGNGRPARPGGISDYRRNYDNNGRWQGLPRNNPNQYGYLSEQQARAQAQYVGPYGTKEADMLARAQQYAAQTGGQIPTREQLIDQQRRMQQQYGANMDNVIRY